MARVTYVKKAQQRYETVPVIDPDTGKQKQTPVMSNGVQKVSKRGPVFLSVTQNDLTRPKPNENCEACSVEIKVGQPYKHVTPKSGPYGGRRRVRCATCPTWQVWDLSNSLSARVAQIEHEFTKALDGAESTDDARSALDDAAASIKEIAEEKRESASSIEDGFGHATYVSEELEDTANQLDEWAEGLESFDVPDEPNPDDEDCPECEGAGTIESEDEGQEDYPCDECSGGGTANEVSDESWDEWRETIASDCGINECPV